MNQEASKFILPGDLTGKFKSFFAEDFFHSPINFWLIIASLALNLTNWVILRIWVKPVDFSIVLHYNVYFGVDLSGNWKQVFFSPVIGLILFILNSLLSLYFYKQKERMASYILLLGAVMIQISLLVYSVSLIVINY